MPQPTTRRGRYYFYKARAQRKHNRRRNSYPFTRTFPVHGTLLGNVNGPIDFVVRHAKMRRMNEYLKRPPHDVISLPPGSTWTEAPATRFMPPHAAWSGGVSSMSPSHQDYAVLNYHRKPLASFGKKIGRMNGLERQVWYATLSAILWEIDTGIRYYPDWDPLGRTPNRDKYWGS